MERYKGYAGGICVVMDTCGTSVTQKGEQVDVECAATRGPSVAVAAVLAAVTALAYSMWYYNI